MIRTIGMTTLLAGSLWLTGCTNGNDLAEASFFGGDAQYDAHGNLMRTFTYFPHQEVYHSVFQDRYHWMDADLEWHRSVELPAHITVNEDQAQIVMLPTSDPTSMHNDVLAMYPSARFLREQIAMIESQYEGITTSVPESIATVPTEY